MINQSTPIMRMLANLEAYCDAYSAEFGALVGDDSVLGVYVAEILIGIRGLLNGSTGTTGLDCGAVDRRILDIAKAHKLEIE